jgi:predicted ATPase
MEITSLHVTGFRSLRDVTWRPGKLNVLIGPNGAGKTNLLRAISFHKEAGTGSLQNTVVKSGGLAQVYWDGSYRDGARWKLDCRDSWFPRPGKGSPQELTYELALQGGYRTAPGGYSIKHELLADFARVQSGAKPQPFKYIERDPSHAVFFDSNQSKLAAAPSERIDTKETLLSQVGGLFAAPETAVFYHFLSAVGVYHELIVSDEAEVRRAAVTRRETRLREDGQNLIAVLHTLYTTDRTFKARLNDAMRAAFGRDFDELEFPPAEDQRVQMRLHWRPLKSSHSSADLSEGTLKLLMLIAILANPARGDFVAIDEPETYLHPAMFPIIAELAATAAESSQVVMTTHSPQFLDALGANSPVTTVVELVEGATQLRILDPKELSRWTKKYTLGELFKSGELEALP